MDQTQQILHDILALGINHIEYVRKQLKNLNLTAEDGEDSEKSKQALFLMRAASAMNDIIHPAFPMIRELFDDEKIHSLIEYYKMLHEKHPARKDFQCPCIACKDEHSSSSADQA